MRSRGWTDDELDAACDRLRSRGFLDGDELTGAGRQQRDQIVQVLQNLIENAVKYTPPGGSVAVEMIEGSLDAMLAPRLDGGARHSLLTPDHGAGLYIGVRVADQGPGIARQNMPRLSERFYRAPGQKSGEKSGTGLGLAIVKHIMNRHRGGLAVESAEGRGAAFTVYFPA